MIVCIGDLETVDVAGEQSHEHEFSHRKAETMDEMPRIMPKNCIPF